MKINAGVVLKARKQKASSQEELAIASGLNLRTIQRIEKSLGIAAVEEGPRIGIGSRLPGPRLSGDPYASNGNTRSSK